jgi:agmatinase
MAPIRGQVVETIVFPFDLFGNSGTAEGARLLGDSLQEAIDDTAEESRPTRPHAFASQLAIQEIPFDTLDNVRNWRSFGRSAFKAALKANRFTLWLSGNHLGVMPVYEALTHRDLVIQFDAHLDCYNLHDTTETLSPGNFLLHAESLPTIINVGHRDLFLTAEDVKATFAEALPIDALATDTASVLALLRERMQTARRIWIDLDVDVFDPAFVPAVHHPLPVGLMPQQFVMLLGAIWSEKIVGLSVSEFDPGRDHRDQSLQLLGWLLEWVLLKNCER